MEDDKEQWMCGLGNWVKDGDVFGLTFYVYFQA